MEALISAQLAQREILEKFIINYKKDGKDKRSKTYYEKRMQNFELLWEEFKNRHTEILVKKYSDKAFNEKNVEYFSRDVFSEMEEFFYNNYSLMQERMQKEFPSDQLVKGVNTSAENLTKESTSASVKLPKIYLERFTGDYRKWPTFHDLFKSLVHENTSLSQVQKLQYLKLHLSGEPEQLLRHFQVTDCNYTTAWNLLNERYNNKRILVNTQLKTLLSQSTLSKESPQGIKGLLDTTTECLQALNNLDVSTANWDPLIVYFIVQRLPSETHQLWEQDVAKTKELSSWKTLQEFLESRFRTLEAVSANRTHNNKDTKFSNNKVFSNPKAFHVATNVSCILCFSNHSIRQCPTFLSYNAIKRMEIVKSKGLCINCLGSGHILTHCPSQQRCWHCKQRHHSLLHRKPNEGNRTVDQINTPNNGATHVQTTNYGSYDVTKNLGSPNDGNMNQPTLSASNHSFIPNSIPSSSANLGAFTVNKSSIEQVLLPTAMVKIISPAGKEQIIRALIDQGSQASFLSESIVQDLNLKRESISANIHGLGRGNTNHVNHRVKFVMKSLKSNTSIEVSALVLKKLTNFLPSRTIPYQKWTEFEELELADPQFYRPNRIDLLLGADIYSQIIMDGIRRSSSGSPIAQKTILGWILSGEVTNQQEITISVQNFHVCAELDDQLKRFWELEEIYEITNLTEEEQICEKHFTETSTRLPDGRYAVELPLRETTEANHLGKSRNMAVSRLLQLERRFQKDPDLKKEYSKCLDEYLTLGHMEEVSTSEDDHAKQLNNVTVYSCNYLPHHGVVKESSSTTKLRVVFDASRATQSGTSLNDMMLKGPIIQDELKTILLRWRLHRVAFGADIEKMYRQVRVKHPFVEYQRLVWRNSPTEPIKDYKLLTATFGTKSAPYLATRVLKQLAIDEKDKYPQGSQVVLSDFYVDDLLSGADTIESALEVQTQLINIMKAGGFSLRKWSSNYKDMLQSLPLEHRENNSLLQISSQESIRTLGMLWNPQRDVLSFTINLNERQKKWTKRYILSETSKLFDPLGLIAPIIVSAKLMIQKLWLAGVGWDDEIPQNLENEWINYCNNIAEVKNIKVNRWVHFTKSNTIVELHGFSDASQKAYAAVVYICVTNDAGERHSSLLISKTRVAPLKTVTLPRLELCAAALLAKLLRYVLRALNIEYSVSIHAWTDSEIVIAWLRSHPSKWATFIANRVSYIHDTLGKNVWGHVPSKENPADCASRGVQASVLQNSELWWTGPNWLRKTKEFWPKGISTMNINLEEREVATHHVTTTIDDLDSRYSSLSKLLRVTAYCKRFISNARNQQRERVIGYLKAVEIQEALYFWIKRVQTMHFNEEIKSLKSNKSIDCRSRILNLNPFLDQDGLMRVGGRLRHSELPYEEKHPIILPSKSALTLLIIDKVHKETLHGGPQLMMNILSKTYWLLNARNTIRHRIFKCIPCFKQRANIQNQLMGDLPAPRIRMARPFAHTGIDYCGPFILKTHRGRNPKKYKAYISLFVCMVTKALHLELVTDLSAEGFIAAFKRFCARRGLCQEIYCDCGTNFVGANRLLNQSNKQMMDQLNVDIAPLLENEGIKFNFIPPSSPHFGGLWEAGVRSTKYHLKRILECTLLTYEEFVTVLTQIEACLNSRPLCEMSSDPRDLTPLTPAHFLIGNTLLTPPEPSLLDIQINRLDRWQYLQRLIQNFWKRWNSEYLCRLQQRPKWRTKTENQKVGDLVLLKDEKVPPCRWILGRIIETHPGPDGLVRVVTIKTKDCTLKRPIIKICKLPICIQEEESKDDQTQKQ